MSFSNLPIRKIKDIDILQAFEIDLNQTEMISLVGAGGKTSTMYRLARELKNKGKKILVTTTTAIYYPQDELYDYLIISQHLDEIIEKAEKIESNTITVLGSRVFENIKLKGIKKNWLDTIFKNQIFDYILVEADGSKRKPIKAPNEFEPVIPELSSTVIGIIGFDCYGKKINTDCVHRPELLIEIADKEMEDLIDKNVIIKLVISKKGLFKNTNSRFKKVLFLNKVNDDQLQIAEEIGNEILQKDRVLEKVVIGSIKEFNPFNIILG